MAAGTLLVEEAGGKISECGANRRIFHGAYLLVDNGLIHRRDLGLFEDIFQGRYPL